MGADIYIIGLDFEFQREEHGKKFHELVAARNAIGKRLPGDAARVIGSVVDGYTPYAKLNRWQRIDYASADGKAYRAACKAVDKNMATQPGYFRDSYNNSSIMQALGLSWWQIANVGGKHETVQLIDDNGHMSLDNIEVFRDVVRAAPLAPLAKATIPAKQAGEGDIDYRCRIARQEWVNDMSDKDLADWNKYFVSKKRKLVAFLNLALKNKAIIYASV